MQTCPFALSVRARSDTHTHSHLFSLVLSCLVLQHPMFCLLFLRHTCGLRTRVGRSPSSPPFRLWRLDILDILDCLLFLCFFFLLPFTGAGPPKKMHLCKMYALPCSDI
ncbi:hypothetical protein BO85DRAFT_255604 [Aspergillus piperis CBS 112811]|uniref:Uncharacterized protein n=1 Tax=Aspergillus piperis CBS 112811 TaxID=1448313 RepID=A0A8G1R636_9EURO|nr:hypothetical protein BO85DRAFT_255604 [Aspergillus piperis CBS 112811]RAH59973.1 hypothetical protein BO85DRAFT_255604 [Aspergillus piperis CBS 112811]